MSLLLYSKGALIHGWWAASTSNDSSSKTFLIAHGRSLPIPVMRDFLKQLVVDRVHNVFIFDYEGYGKTNGTPTEKNMNADANVALDYVARRMNISVRYEIEIIVASSRLRAQLLSEFSHLEMQMRSIMKEERSLFPGQFPWKFRLEISCLTSLEVNKGAQRAVRRKRQSQRTAD